MKYYLLKIILLALLTFAGQEVFAYDCYVGGIYYDLDDTNRTASVTFKDQTLNSYSGAVTIPESITYNKKTYFVTSIGNNAFHFCSGLTSIEIPNSVTTIGGDAFFKCSGLTSVTIPNSVTTIGGDAFSMTPWYRNLQDGIIYIGKVLYKFKGAMPENTSIQIKEGTSCISGFAFKEYTSLTSITIPNSVTIL